MRGKAITETLLWIVFGLGLVLSIGTAYEARTIEAKASVLFPIVQPGISNISPHQSDTSPNSVGLMGRLVVPAIDLSVPIIDNDDPDSLRKGVGHIPGTAVAGGLGNLVLAGHRDTFLRALRNIHAGMPIRVLSREGAFVYITDSTEIVKPTDVQVADIGKRPEMTLITCYPFSYIGAAPKRFVVHAYLKSLDPI